MRFILPLLFLTSQAFALIRYVDNAATGANNGTSWANAWTHPTLSNGQVGPGDIVYISGGPAGTTKTYNFTAFWDVPNGNDSAQLTYTIGQEAGHNGEVLFQGNGQFAAFLTGLYYVTFDFWKNNQRHLKIRGGNVAFHDWDANRLNYSIRFRLLGADINSQTRMYGSRETEFGWCLFGIGPLQGAKFTGGPGWITGIGTDDWRHGFTLRTSIHDCQVWMYVLLVPVNGDNGDDFVTNCGQMDMYNNTIISMVTTGWAGDNHQDFVQTDMPLMRYYNNYFENAGNYCIFGEFFGPNQNAGGWYIFNNVFNYTDPTLSSNPTACIGIGNNTHQGTITSWTNFKVWNNLFRLGGRACAIGAISAGPINRYYDCDIMNNINVGGRQIILQDGILDSASFVGNNPIPPNDSWFVNVAGKDFHLTSAATGAIGTAIFESWMADFSALPAAATSDKDGNPRGAQPWDCGPYEFAPSVGPGILTYSMPTYSVGEAGPTVTLTVNRINGSSGIVSVSYNTSNGTATAGTDYAATTGVLTWASGDSAAKSYTVAITQDSDAEPSESFNNTLSSPSSGATLGANSSALVTIVDDEPPVIPLMGSLSFEAEAGLIESPFSTTAGTPTYISQTADSNLGEGGLARWRVTIPATGSYKIIANVNCPSTGNDSLWISFDGEPTATDIWDVGATSGFQDKTVTWRGTGGPGTPEFSPKFWALSGGIRTLYIRGREPNMQINSIQIVAETPPTDTAAPTPNPPTWEQEPIAPQGFQGWTSITMIANPASDATLPIEYNFDEISGNFGGTDSGWQASRVYTDTGLAQGTTYRYVLRYRDGLGNTTNPSAEGQGTTGIQPQGVGTINASNLRVTPTP